MLPSLVAEDLQDSLTSFLGTTFALADDDVRTELERFIADPDDGVFRGPYVRLRTPFRPADDPWSSYLGWTPKDFRPHKHQAQAWMRLSSKDALPEPTLVTTGTGSGKTETFLIPLLEHCRRHQNQPGIKALVLYPMNALANDQARRIAKLVHDHRDQLGDITVGLYTGDSGSNTAMTPTTVVEDKHHMRQSPPDILLTNYKMLDMLLLRSEDTPLFRHAGESLRYLVLDEFHTYDGAQGTDVAMLLRRLGTALGVTTDERPLGAITPIATSATLGSGVDAGSKLRDFAQTVFGCEFDAESLVGEDRLTVDEWVTPPEPDEKAIAIPLLDRITTTVDRYAPHEEQLQHAAALFLGLDTLDPRQLGEVLRAHPLTERLLRLTQSPRPLTEIATELEPSWGGDDPRRREAARHAVSLYLALLSRARTSEDRPLLAVDVQLWVREVSRLLRRLGGSPRFQWFEGAPAEDGERALPSVFCRNCGRSGWGVVATPGGGTAVAPQSVWSKSASDPGVARVWLYAPGEARQGSSSVRWVDPDTADFVDGPTGKHSNEVPVLVTPDAEAAKKETCPSCGQERAIRFLGSRVATLASAALGQLFGNGNVAEAEKKTLVFTDSVQDASHRASFVESRAYALNRRSLVYRAVGEGTTLDEVGRRIESAATTPSERYALLPPELRLHETFRKYWEAVDGAEPEQSVRDVVATRMGFEALREFGLDSRTGRTMELTGTTDAHVEIDDVDTVVRRALDDVARQSTQITLDGVEPHRTRAWARGLVERLRTEGGVEHRWFERFATTDDDYSIWGGRPRREGMPAFPRDRPKPAFPTTARSPDHLVTITGTRSWYATWTSRVLDVPKVDAHRYILALLNALVADSALARLDGPGGNSVWWIPAGRVRLAPTVGVTPRLRCSACMTVVPGPPVVLDDLRGAPCLRDRCPGSYREEPGETRDYYRDLYRRGEVRRIIAREHTSLLDAKERVELETSFKTGRGPDAPNVLTCTPTLELGIDIGDLSTVALTSLPRSTASYLQRVGRAGRLTGNALVVSLLPARPLELQRLADPSTMIAGEVIPPACYLDATEILRRQYLASLIDRRSRSGAADPTRRAKDVFAGGLTASSWLGALVSDARANADAYLDEFLRGFADDAVGKDSRLALREWAAGVDGEPPGLERDVEAAVVAWNAETEELAERLERLKQELATFEAKPSLDDAGKRELRRLRGELGAARSAWSTRDTTYWISALEARGLLPNYALLDDTTTLDVGLWWIDEESGEHRSADEQYVRGSRTALAELAPGATFYVKGTSVEIDGVDLGTSRNPATVQRRFCPACGWSRRWADGETASPCPRCGSVQAADAGQILTTLPFRRASAHTSRERALRDHENEERVRTRFAVLTTVDAEPADITSAWRLAEYPFGAEVLRSADIRWINLGPADRGGVSTQVAGHDVTAPRFEACRYCGVVPAAQSGVRELAEARHRGWCRQRKEPDADPWTTVVLTHELRTQAVRLLVPPVVVADATVRTSFRAALLLGLRQMMGGAPEHLDVVEAADPSSGGSGSERWVMVLHDLVPGGTGYLREFADSDGVRALLAAALEVLQTCPCRTENVAACHRCLLPHVAPHQAPNARRDSAISLLTEILQYWEPEPVDTIRNIVVGSHDTPIEKRFRALLIQWAKSRNAAVTVTAGNLGDRADIRFPKHLDGRHWRLTPQVPLGGVKPDFVLESTDQTTPKIAVFCDGQAYHSSTKVNRLADDAEKRAGLRAQGYLVWALTHHDLDVFGAVMDGGARAGLAAVDDVVTARAVQEAQKAAVPGSATGEDLLVDPMSLLVGVLLRPSPDIWTPPAHALALAHCLVKAPVERVARTSVPTLVHSEIVGKPPAAGEGMLPVVRARSAHGCAVTLERRDRSDVRVWLGVDDRAGHVGTPGQVDAWRDWLALSNALQFLDPERFAAHTATTVEHVSVSTVPTVEVAPAWKEIAETFDGPHRDQVLGLGAAGLPLPEAGHELDGGDVVVDLAWPDPRIAVLLEPDDETSAWLSGHGWRIVAPEPEDLRKALEEDED